MERLTAAFVGRRLDRVETAQDQVQQTLDLLGTGEGPQRLALGGNLAPFDTLKRIAQIARTRLNIQTATLPILESHRQFEKEVLTTVTRAQDSQRQLDRLWQQHPGYDQEYLIEALNDPAKEEKNRLAKQIVQAQMTPFLRHSSRRIRRPDTSYQVRHDVFYEVPLPNGQILQTKSATKAFIANELKETSTENPLDFRAMLRRLTGTSDYQSYTAAQQQVLETETALRKKGYCLERQRAFIKPHGYGSSGSRVYLYMTELKPRIPEEVKAKANSKPPAIAQQERVDPILTLRRNIDEAIANIQEVRQLYQIGTVADILLHRAQKAYSAFIKTQPLPLVAESVVSYLQQTGSLKSQIIPRILSALTYTNSACTLSTQTLAQELYGKADEKSLFKANGYMFSLRKRIADLRLGLDITAEQQPKATMKPQLWQRLRRIRPLVTFREPTTYYLNFAA